MPRFIRRHENGNIEIFPFTGAATVGRSRKNEVVIDDQSVSSHHAKVEKGADGWMVADLESRNGTRVNEAEGTTAKLKHGDQVKFGKILVTFELDDPEPGEAAAAAPAPAPAARVASRPPAAAAGGAAPSPFAHTMAPVMPPAELKAAAAKQADVAAAPKPPAKVEAPAKGSPAAAPARPAAEAPRPAAGAMPRTEQAELKLRVLKEQVRALQNQRLILMSIAAGLALTTVIFLVAMLMYRTSMLELKHKTDPSADSAP